MTHFKVSYSEHFNDQDYVKTVISQWQTGSQLFTLSTSGSTGEPKTIQLNRNMLIWSAEKTYAALDLQNKQGQLSVLCCLPVQKTGGFMQLIRALHFNWHIHFIPATANPNAELGDYPSSFDLFSFTPTQLQTIIASDEALLSPQTAILIGGAAISSDFEEEIQNFALVSKTAFWETYGMTETASHIALRKLGIDSYFKPQPGVEISTTEDQRLRIAIPELDFSITTNDMAIVHTDGFEILGRSDDVINSGGIKIHPSLIEPKIKALLHTEGIERHFYLGKKKDVKLGEKAVLVLEGTALKDISHLLEILKRELPIYHNPKDILFVEEIAYTDTGKIIRAML
ncbi:MAG: AMP-binding protein [Bacteroidia bacterium]